MYEGATRISFIIATIGRPSLGRAIRSITSQQLVPGDEIILVGQVADPDHELAAWDETTVVNTTPGGDYGAYERRIGMAYATGTHLMFVDDDDALLPGAVVHIRRWADDYPGRPIMFKMVDPNGLILPTEQVVREGNHGGPQFVTPNVKGKLGVWSSRYECDFDFAVSTLALYPPGSLVWSPAIIYGCRTFGGD